MPAWVKVAIDAWTGRAGVVDGYIFRPVNRGGRIQGDVLSEKVVWQMLKPYAKAAGVAGIAPHDCRRTAAKLCRAAGGELEQIQLLLGHASPSRRPSGTSARSRISCMRRTTGSS